MKIEIDRYKTSSDELQKCVGQIVEENRVLQMDVGTLKSIMASLESACNNQRQILDAVAASRFTFLYRLRPRMRNTNLVFHSGRSQEVA
ncbi:hypothetical protein EVAR_97833_1 [Eumeta japonica]|uniref:Uncharacterized protein n=1 Tax=Eumeta variegata TaxID=151549 RepID=A0A4C1SGU8_EUMVA|nr:hypothetical protein EVAR_97833_1 [Eumeta japonica]